MARRIIRKAPPPRRKSGCGSCIATLLTLAVLAGLGVFLAVYLTDAESPRDLIPENFHPGDFIPNFEEFFQEDPFNATTPEDANRWRGTSNQGGLSLELVNALDPEWNEYFDLAVSQWEAGDPDVLTLSVSYDTPDAECTPIRSKMKVCDHVCEFLSSSLVLTLL